MVSSIIQSQQRFSIVHGIGTRLNKNAKQYNFFIHRLVAMAFVDNPKRKTQVNHINGHVIDNRAENLEWVTPSENVLDAINIRGRIERCGEYNNKSKLTTDQVLTIRTLYKTIRSQRKIAKMYSVTQTAIKNIVNNKTWKHLNHTKTLYEKH